MMFFFCTQKTAYEVRISDWSSDVCSSDLEELEKRIRRTGKNWTLTQDMFASMIVFVVAAGAMLMVRAPVLMAGLVGLLLSLGLPYLVVGMTIKRRVDRKSTRLNSSH